MLSAHLSLGFRLGLLPQCFVAAAHASLHLLGGSFFLGNKLHKVRWNFSTLLHGRGSRALEGFASGLFATITGCHNAAMTHLLGAIAKQLLGHPTASNSHINLLTFPCPKAFVDTAVWIFSRLCTGKLLLHARHPSTEGSLARTSFWLRSLQPRLTGIGLVV